mgnify:FL=1
MGKTIMNAKNIVLFGTNDWSDMICFYMQQDERYNPVAYTVDRAYLESETRNGLPVVPFENIEELYPTDNYEIMICLGYTKMNTFREAKIKECVDKGYRIASYVHPTAIVLTDKVGVGNLIMEGAIVGYACNVGNHNIISYGARIGHNTTIGDYNFVAGGCTTGGEVTIKNNCMLGLNCTVRNCITLDD